MERFTLLLVLLLPSLAPTSGSPSPSGASTPIDLVVETLKVGPAGTETASSDDARVLPGRGASLDKEVTLSGKTSRGTRAQEKVRFRVQFRVERPAPDRVTVTMRSRVNVLAATGGIAIPTAAVTRSAIREVIAGTSQIFEIYESASLRTKIALNLRWVAPEGEEIMPVPGTLPVPFTARLYDLGEGGPVLISENLLSATFGGSAAATFSRNVSLSPGRDGAKRYREEQLEITLSPRFRIGRDLSVELEVKGQVVTRSGEGDLPHPVIHQGNHLLSSGIPAGVDLEVAGDAEGEGWSRLRYRVEVSALF